MENRILIGFGILFLVYLLFKLFQSWKKPTREFEQELNKILTSSEHKVKGRFD